MLLRYGCMPTAVAVEVGSLWFVRSKCGIRIPFLGYIGSTAMYAETICMRGPATTQANIWYALGRMQRGTTPFPVVGFAAEAGGDERRRTGKRVVELTTLSFFFLM